MTINLGQLTREKVKELAPNSLVILPIGAIEQHGPHLPLYTDYYIVKHISKQVCERLKGHISPFICPVLPYGNSHHHFPEPTLSLTSHTFIRVIKDLVDSLVKCGFKKIVLLNSHGGNDEAIRIVARDAAREHDISIAAASYWTIAWDALLNLYNEEGISIGGVPGHAGGFETSLMLALDDQFVNMESRPPLRNDELPKKDIKERFYIQRHGNSVGDKGYSDDARNASRSLGEKTFDIIVEEVAKSVLDFFSSHR